MRLSQYKAGTILVAGDVKVFINDGFVNADGMIQKSNGIGNCMKEGCCRKANSQEVSEFFAKVRKTQKIINY